MLVEAYQPGSLLQTLHGVIGLYVGVLEQHNRGWWREVSMMLFTASADGSDAATIYQTLDEEAHGKLNDLLAAAQTAGDLRDGLDLALLAHTLFAVIEYAFLRYILDEQQSAAEALESLRNQVELLVTPYLT